MEVTSLSKVDSIESYGGQAGRGLDFQNETNEIPHHRAIFL